MSSGKDVPVVDKRATTDVSAGIEQTGDPGPLALLGSRPTDDPVGVLVSVLSTAGSSVEGRRRGRGRYNRRPGRATRGRGESSRLLGRPGREGPLRRWVARHGVLGRS